MARSRVRFARWSSHEISTWPYQVSNQYNLEVGKQIQAHRAGSRKAYASLGEEGASWADPVDAWLTFVPPKKAGIFRDLKDWSASYNAFDNWINLNSIVATSSILETYLATVVRLALESDPGIVLGRSRLVDGVHLLKAGKYENFRFGEKVVACTRGDWQSRISGFATLFGEVPSAIQDSLGDLEAIRNLRNSVAHAIGREIEDSRLHGAKAILPIRRISNALTNKYSAVMTRVAKAVDAQLLERHIGDYEVLHFYHRLAPKLKAKKHPSERAVALKKEIGGFGAVARGKDYCKGVVEYYESI